MVLLAPEAALVESTALAVSPPADHRLHGVFSPTMGDSLSLKRKVGHKGVVGAGSGTL